MSDYFDGSDETEASQSAASESAPSESGELGPVAASLAWRPTLASSSSERTPDFSLVLTNVECRVLGALIEKAFLTPDVYPMTTKGLATACNQKTNRDPVVSYSPIEIDNTLLELRQRSLVRRVHAPGARSSKHRHTLDEQLSLDDGELALMSVLMLRGEQTIGELRLRTERQHPFPDLESTEDCLRGLATRSTPLVRQLERQPGHKEARWQHLLSGAQTPESPQPTDAAVPSPAPSTATAESAAPVALTARIDALEAEVATLRRQLNALAGQLGETLE